MRLSLPYLRLPQRRQDPIQNRTGRTLQAGILQLSKKFMQNGHCFDAVNYSTQPISLQYPAVIFYFIAHSESRFLPYVVQYDIIV